MLAGYGNYRVYLADMVRFRKSRDPQFSYRSLAEVCGIKSAGFLSLVVNGKRNLGSDLVTARAIANGIGLTKREAKLFEELVLLNQEGDADRKQKKLRRLSRKTDVRKHRVIDEGLLGYLEDWHTVAIHELAGRPDFQMDPAWVANQFFPRLTKSQAKRSLTVLVDLGLLYEDAEGRTVRSDPQLTTPDEFHREVVRHYHLQLGRLACNAVERLPATQRNFGAVTGRVSQADLPKLMAFMHKVRNEFNDFMTTLESEDADTVVQANFQFFPLTHTKG